jgi:hypothetical protein
MVLEHEILPYFQWLFYGTKDALGALPRYLMVVLAVALLGLMLGALLTIARKGLMRGGDQIFSIVMTSFREFFELSPRRILALTRLAMKEAWRRRVVVALIVYFIILLFASWFLKTNHREPARLYVSFVLMATTYLVLGIALVLSTFSLPSDFKSKTIYTVVTKPVRMGEIILGRIFGFCLVGTILLLVMSICSYIFIVRSLDHQHTVLQESLKPVTATAAAGTDVAGGYLGRTTTDADHYHELEFNQEQQGKTSLKNGHYHAIASDGHAATLLGPQGYLRARVPHWGKLRFKNSKGVDKARGISVGSEWTYRSFIEGATLASAIWTFEQVDDSIDDQLSKEGLPLGLITRVFRTHKGIIGVAIPGTIQLRNPETGQKSQPLTFVAKDAQVEEQFIERKLLDSNGKQIDLFNDLVNDQGQLEIWIQCNDRGQYFGFAQADCYLRMPDGSPIWNYTKAYISIWVQMVMVTAIGVAASALLSGPVAMLFTVSFIVLGFFREFFVKVADGSAYGGGPVESLYRLVTQKNVISPLDPGPGATLIESIDGVLRFFMMGMAQLLPDFATLSTTSFVAYGYDIPAGQIAQECTTCLGYVIGLAVIGYYLLRTREVAR